MSKKLVRLWKRPCKGGQEFRYVLIWTDEQCKERWKALGHADSRKAERQRAQMERELRMGLVEPASMRLSKFLKDSLARTRGQVRESTLRLVKVIMDDFIKVLGNLNLEQVQLQHGERYIQACLDRGNSPATVAKKVRHLKRIFQLAVERGQLEKNPLKHLRQPKSPKRKVRIFTDEKCESLMKVARDSVSDPSVRWDLLIMVALTTGMRRGEILNTTWRDIDFARKAIEVNPKKESQTTWEWHIKDTERRTLPLTGDLLDLLAAHHVQQPEGYPYVFVPTARYDHIQTLRRAGQWSVERGTGPLTRFGDQFRSLLCKAGIDYGTFHDLRRTCLSRWFKNGLREYDVMLLAGHACFETTRQFYLATSDDLLERARRAMKHSDNYNFIANPLQTPDGDYSS